jgi:PAS domain S-box-containing protein
MLQYPSCCRIRTSLKQGTFIEPHKGRRMTGQCQPPDDLPARELSRSRFTVTATVLSVVAAGVFLLDVITPQSVDVPILYMFMVLLCLRVPWPQAPFLAAASALLLISIPPAFLWAAPLDWSILVNRAITGVALIITALLVANRCTAEAAVRESQAQLGRRVEERTAQLRGVNQALETEIAIRRDTERSLKESLERLARTEAFSLVMVTHVGLDGRWLKVPTSLCELLGYSETELLSGSFMSVTHPEDLEADWSQCQRLIKGEIKSFELEKRYIRKDGEIVWVYLNCSGVYDEDCRLLHFLTYIRNITDRKQVEAALRQSEAKWRRVMETVPVGIVLSTEGGDVLDANTAAWTILGYESKDEFLQQAPVTHYLQPEDRRRHVEALRAGQRVFETQHQKKDGSLLWARSTGAILNDGTIDHRTVFIHAYEDITDQRTSQDALERTRQDLQRANERLTERDQTRTKFLSVVSHELRTPMAAIKGFVDNMVSGVTGDVTAQQLTYFQRITTNIDRLTRLIAQILDWSRLEMGGLQLMRAKVSPTVVVRAVSENAQALASAKDVTIHLNLEPDLPAVDADSDKLEQVLWNLVGNAIKFTPRGGQVTIECRRAGTHGVLFVVSDTGCGIPEEELSRVFDQFSGITSSGSSARGAQLGLYISKSLVALHGGRIWAESLVGTGSRFYVELPVEPPMATRKDSGT